MSSLSRRRARCSPAVLVTTVLLVLVGAAPAATAHPNAAPPKLVGKWIRTVSKADTTRAGGLILAAGRRATFTVAKNGHWTAVIAGLGGLGMADGTVVSAGTGRLRFVMDGEPTALYRWRLSGSTLTLTKITDAVPDRVEFFWGTWKRAA